MNSPNISAIESLLEQWVDRHAGEGGRSWLREQRSQIAGGAEDWVFFTSFSSVPRRLGKADLSLDDRSLEDAANVRSNWDPSHWSLDQAARALLVLTLPHADPDRFFGKLEKVFQTADVRESVALHQALPLLPHPRRWVLRATEGVRSNMAPVFEAVALRNPYPAEQFDEAQWNQMVLKAVFIGSPLHRIQGLEARANPPLARMLVDFVHERWSAGRHVSPEVWRVVGRFAGDEWVSDLERVLLSGSPLEQRAAALALSESPSPKASRLLSSQPELSGQIQRGELSWRHLSAASLRDSRTGR